MAKVFLRAYNREIETMIDRGQLDEAIAHCHHILKTFPKHLETYRLLGKAYLEGKRYGDAVDVFSRIVASVPNDFVAHVGMSIIRDEENKLDDAIWHMERAFEVQPSNAAIQSELQRLYGRRDGVQPPRIRMTRGALAHMYVQGELYPQAISEIKSVLSEDPGRSDMQALLARAYFKSGAKNDAVDAALALLQRYPFSLDANRVLAEVLSADRNENAQSYRQRVVELDPYAAQVSGSIFLSNEVSEAAVAIERLDWNGQPVGMQSDWRDQQAISLESGASRGEQPDWMNSPFGETTPPQPTTGSMFDMPAASPAQPADEIPDFMKAAGWGESTGAFDESKPIFGGDEARGPVEPIAEGDLPDWVKAMKPAEPEPAAPSEEEELPDWINKIGTGALSASAAEPAPEQTIQSFPAPSGDEPDWLKGFGETQQPAQASQDQPDWLQGFGSETESAAQPAESDTSDWLKGLGEEPQTADASATDGLEWLQGVGSEPESTPEPAASETPDWLKGTESVPAAEADDLDWLKGIGEAESASEPAASETPDWLKGVDAEPETAAATDDLDWLKGIGETESQPSAESTAGDLGWLQGIGEEPDTTPQPAQVETPDWLKGIGEPEPESAPASESENEWLNQFGAISETTAPASEAEESKDFDFLNELTQEPVLQTPDEAAQPASSVEDLGKSTQEQDDSFAWLESLAAKQGASEGLLTRPEERMETEPEWVKQAKGLSGEVPAAQPAVGVEDLGKSPQEQDDSFAWLESLAAKQGASEGLLTKPEERMEQEPEWVKQAKGLTAEPVSQTPANVEDLGRSSKEQDDSFAWLENLAAKQGATEGLLTKPEERMQEEPEWVKQAKSAPVEPPVAQAPTAMEELGKSEQDDSLAWLENLASQPEVSEGALTQPEELPQEEPDRVQQSQAQTETPVSQPESKVEEFGTSEQERDDAFAWLESLAAKQGASEGLLTKPEERMEQEPEWVRQAKDFEAQQLPEAPAAPSEAAEEPAVEQTIDEQSMIEQPASASDTGIWLHSLVEEEEKRPEPAADETAMWLRSLDAEQTVPTQPEAEPVDTELPAWMENIEQQEVPAAEAGVPTQEPMEAPVPEQAEESGLPSWLSDLEKEEQVRVPSNADDLPAWLRDETGEVVAEPVKIEPTRPTDWKPAEETQPEIVYSPPLEEPQPPEIIYSPPLEETPQAEPVASVEAPREQEPVALPSEEKPKTEPKPARKAPSRPASEAHREPVTTSPGPGGLVMPGIDQTLGSARSEFSRSNIPGGLDLYAKLIKKGRFLDEVIYDLREALYRFPVEVNIWQSLGDAYMRANRLQDALDAYTKAEELLR